MSVLWWYCGTLTYRTSAIGTDSTVTIYRKTVHIPWYDEEGHAVKEPQSDYSIPYSKGRLLQMFTRAASTQRTQQPQPYCCCDSENLKKN